ncbi:MAG: CBS domain-containing protein [Acidimicrobiales bacterium]|nr:CBS domain-containing protein [Acidimicrobiales bacterium]
MQVSVLLQSKGSEVVTVGPDTTMGEAIDALARHRIGAVVVTGDGHTIEGVVAERDVVLSLSVLGPTVLSRPVSEVMNTDVVTCRPDTTIEHLMSTMTDRRVRHVPVTVDGHLVGLVSIGDVVKDRISGLEFEARVLHEYISHPY